MVARRRPGRRTLRDVQRPVVANAIPMVEMRRGLGIPGRADRAAGTVPTPVDDTTLDALLRDRRPLIGSSFATAGIAVITWLMETKPF